MHLGARGDHPHGLLVDDQDPPLELARSLVVGLDGRLNDVRHDF